MEFIVASDGLFSAVLHDAHCFGWMQSGFSLQFSVAWMATVFFGAFTLKAAGNIPD